MSVFSGGGLAGGSSGGGGEGGGTGLVETVGAGAGIDVDDADEANPIVALSAGAQASLALADSALQSADLASYAPLNSPALTGTPTAPTPTGTDSTTKLATTQFVQERLTALIGTAAANLDTLGELADALNDDASFAASVTTSLAGKQALNAALTSISGLTPSDDDILQRKSGAWTNRTMAQLRSDFQAVALSGTWTFNGTGSGSTAAILVQSATPCICLDDSDQGTNMRRWNYRSNGGSLILEAVNNSDAAPKQFLNVARATNSSDITGMIYGNTTDLPTHKFRGELICDIAGRGVSIREGANCRMGVATLVGGTVTVANTAVTANTRIMCTVQTAGGTQGHLSTSRVAGTSFTITSTSASETSTVAWHLIEPAS